MGCDVKNKKTKESCTAWLNFLKVYMYMLGKLGWKGI